MNKIKKNLAPFSLVEKLKIISFKILKKTFKINTTSLIRKYNFIIKLNNQKIHFKFINNFINFKYVVKKSIYNFSLLKQSSDIDVFEQIIFEEEYKSIIEISKEKNIYLNRIIDAGANIGLVTLYLKAFFPEAHIISLEPSKSTFLRLKNNIKINNLKNVELLNEGIWSVTTKLYGDFSFGDGRDWAFSLKKSNDHKKNNIPVNSIKDLMQKNNFDTIDFLKIDIEGGEAELFNKSSDTSWLKQVKLIAIEIHDELNLRDSIESKLKENNFNLIHSGELTIGVNFSLT